MISGYKMGGLCGGQEKAAGSCQALGRTGQPLSPLAPALTSHRQAQREWGSWVRLGVAMEDRLEGAPHQMLLRLLISPPIPGGIVFLPAGDTSFKPAG